METYAARRKALFERLGRGVVVIPATPVALRNNDVEHAYRQDSDVHYLTGFDEPEAVLVLCTDHPEHEYVLFVRPRDPERETWDGERAGVDGAVQKYGADAAFPIAELAQRLPDYLQNHQRLVYRLGKNRDFDARVFAAMDATRARARSAITWPTEYVDPVTLVHELRLHKGDDEIALMRRGIEITRDAHLAAMKATAPGKAEYEIDAVIGEVYRRNGCERAAYESIVASGPHATTLHHRSGTRRMADGELLLVDAGCEHAYYATDVTRTWPVGGRFSAPQRAIYEIVLQAELASIEAVRPGATLDRIHQLSVEIIVDGLRRLGLLTGDRQRTLDEHLYKRFYMHRTSHWLGMDVHDVGLYYLKNEPRPLEAGMVLTVEPGIYIRKDDETVPPEYRGIGVRIEDDVLVTKDGHDVLTAAIPKGVDEIERACAG